MINTLKYLDLFDINKGMFDESMLKDLFLYPLLS